jgi:hypothetical protein
MRSRASTSLLRCDLRRRWFALFLRFFGRLRFLAVLLVAACTRRAIPDTNWQTVLNSKIKDLLLLLLLLSAPLLEAAAARFESEASSRLRFLFDS